MENRKLLIRRITASFLSLTLFFSLAGCKKDATKENNVTTRETVPDDIVYFEPDEIDHLYDPDDGDVEIMQVAGDENGIAIFMHINKYVTDAQTDSAEFSEEDFYSFYQIVLIDEDGDVNKTISLKGMLADEAWPQSFTRRKDGSFSIFLSPLYRENGESDGNMGVFTIDSEGNPIGDISYIPIGKNRNPNQILLGEDGNFYIKGYEESLDMMGNEFIAVFNPSGKELFFEKADQSNSNQIFWGQSIFSDGTDIYIDINQYSETNSGYFFCKLDMDAGKLGNPIDIPDMSAMGMNSKIQSGNGTILLTNDSGAFEIDIKEKSLTPFFLWKDLDMDHSADEVKTIVLNKDLFFVSTKTWYRGDDWREESHFYLLQRTDKNPNSGKKIILLGGLSINWNPFLQKAVYLFNKTSTTHRVEIYDYQENSETVDYMQTLNMMNMEILAGDVPDIIVGSSFDSMDAYIVKDIIADINPLIASDSDISKDDFFNNILSLDETDGKLYKINANFSLLGLIGPVSLIGDRDGWSVDEFEEVVSEFPENMKPMHSIDQGTLLQMAYISCGEQFVDWAAKDVNFDSDAFISLLNYAKTYGSNMDELNPGGMQIEFDINKAIQNKELALVNGFSFMSIGMFSSLRETYGEPITMVGFPSAGKNGLACYSDMSFSISEKSADKEAAWEFIKILLSGDIQNELGSDYSGFPVLRSSMDKLISKEKNKNPDMGGTHTISMDGLVFTIENIPLSDETANDFLKIIDNLQTGVSVDSGVSNIIAEEVDAFFKDAKTADETAKIIQNRVQTLVNERA